MLGKVTDFRLGTRKYEVAKSEDELALGDPHVQICILTDRKSYGLAEKIQVWETEVERATGNSIVVTVSGDNEHAGSSFKALRTPELIRVDNRSSKQYQTTLRTRSGTRMSELHANADIAKSIAVGLGVDQAKLPCIAWRTWPNVEPTVTTPIKRQWFASEASMQRWIDAFIAWFAAGHYQRLTRSGMTVGELRRVVRSLAPRLSQALDRGVLGHRNRPRRRSDPRLPVSIRFEGEVLDESLLRAFRPARLRIGRGDESKDFALTQNQLFYLTAFVFCGTKQRIDGCNCILVDEKRMTARLSAWSKAGLKSQKREISDKLEHRIAKEWRRFARLMNERVDLKDWFWERVIRDTSSPGYYRQRADRISLSVELKNRIWLQDMLRKLTDQS